MTATDMNTAYQKPTRKATVLLALAQAGATGLTAKEFAEDRGLGVTGVNTWTGSFTVLRQDGKIAALSKEHSREGNRVYVLPGHVNGRETWSGFQHHCPGCRCGEDS